MPPAAEAAIAAVCARRFDVAASVGARVALGAYPVAFIATFGWAYGKQSFDTAAAAINWTSYLNVFLLSGFVLVPPAVARLRTERPGDPADLATVGDHIALGRWLLVAAVAAAFVLGLTIEQAFPELASASEGRLTWWFAMFAALAIAQLPLVLWLGVAQASGRYLETFGWVVGSRMLAIMAIVGSAAAGFPGTAAIAASTLLALAGQAGVVHVGRRAWREVSETGLPGRAMAALPANLSAGLIALIGTLVTIAPVTLVGHMIPDQVGAAHLVVALSNAFGAVAVAALFPASLALARNAADASELRGYAQRVARRVVAVTAVLLGAGWLVYPACVLVRGDCGVSAFVAASLVLAGAGLRLGSLGVYHGALAIGRPHIALPSALAEAVAVVLLSAGLVGHLGLLGLGVAFIAGGAMRLAFSLVVEIRLLATAMR